MKAAIASLTIISGSTLHGGDYAQTITTTDTAGGAQASADYSQQSSAGGIFGIAADPAPAMIRSGFAGQIADPVSLSIAPSAASIPEGSTFQESAEFTLDDDTLLAVPAEALTWTVRSGPVAISPGGLVTAGYVYQDSIARIAAAWQSMHADQTLTVRNIGDDDFRPYDHDGISDAWQVAWFGENNPDGRSAMDPDHDGQDNAFEFLSGYSPLDGSAFLNLRAVSLDGVQFTFELSRVRPGVVYQIESSGDLNEWILRDKITSEATIEPFPVTLTIESEPVFVRALLTKAP